MNESISSVTLYLLVTPEEASRIHTFALINACTHFHCKQFYSSLFQLCQMLHPTKANLHNNLLQNLYHLPDGVKVATKILTE